jgi:hypothetical protein
MIGTGQARSVMGRAAVRSLPDISLYMDNQGAPGGCVVADSVWGWLQLSAVERCRFLPGAIDGELEHVGP